MDAYSSGRFWRHPIKPQLRLVFFFVANLLGVAFLLAFLLWEGYCSAERQAETDSTNLAGVVETRLNSTLRRVHGDLEQIAATLPGGALNDPERFSGEAVSRELQLQSAHFPEILGYQIVDRHGVVRISSAPESVGVNVADRSYFKALAKDPSQSLVISEVLVGRPGGRPVMVMASPLMDFGNSLRGMVIAPLNLDHFRHVFDSVSLGAHGVIVLRRSDNGQLVLRRPELPDAVNRALSVNPMHRRIEAGDRSGTIRFRAVLDGVERVYAYQRVGDYPFYVAVGLATNDYLASWRRTAAIAVTTSLLLVLSLALVLIRLLRVEREEAITGAKLKESEARYRMLADNSHDVIWTLDIPTRRFTYVSPSVRQLRGYSAQEVMAQPLEASLTPESAERVNREIDQRLRRIASGDRQAQVLTSELDQLCRDGGVVSTEVVSTYLLDADGVARTILGITRNVSERKAAEDVLRETNRQLQVKIAEIERLQEALQQQAVRDGLTGLYNRRYLDETLERELARARREGQTLSLVMLDIDHFKRINDNYGHQAGDEVLKSLSAILLADVRTEDVACRYGGEEFLILLPKMPLAAALERAEIWRATIERLSIDRAGVAIRFTISLGVAAYPGHGKTPDELTRCADRALYQAKREGRNRAVVFSD